uniref:Transmembrane protein 182 n=1 Tax=Cyclopterus lumpus TaxID=8103 RepID=A0A8C2WBZ4_CYCLU
MRVGAATLAGGIFGLVGTLCFFLAFGTDYWLVATRRMCRRLIRFVGCFWGFSLHFSALFVLLPQKTFSLHLFFLFHVANQPESKLCIHGYLFPLPVALGPVPHPSYDATAGMFRGFWTVLIVLGLVAALTGGFLLVCGVPFSSHKLHTLGGAFLIAAACLFLFVLLLFVLWMEVMDVERYVLQERGEACPQAQVSVLYGLSFMVAAAGVPLELVSGMVFMLVGRALRASK